MTAIVDYGVGNLFSLKSSFAFAGEEAIVTGKPEEILSADRVVLPGVGAFGDAADKLRSCGLDRTLLEAAASGQPLLGVCLGMQLLFDRSYEFGEHEGLGLIPGSVHPLEGMIPAACKIPQIGWNALHFTERESPLFRNIRAGDCVYFVHSYHATDCCRDLIATTEYGGLEVTAAVQRGKVFGCQFHPEKSGRVGLDILRAFCSC